MFKINILMLLFIFSNLVKVQSSNAKNENRSKRETSNFKEGDNVAFEKADIVIDYHLSESKIIQLEAFKLLSNDDILLKNDSINYPKLHWFSLGYPQLTKMKNEKEEYKLFHFKSTGFFTFISMLNNFFKELIIREVKRVYSIDIQKEQVTALAVSKLECKIRLKCKKDFVDFIGSVNHFKEWPMRMDFEFNKYNEMYEDCIRDKLSLLDEDLDLKCQAIKESKKSKSNILQMNFKTQSENELLNDLFGPANSTYVTRYQIDKFSTVLRSHLDIVELYEMAEHEFNQNFVEDLIKQTSDIGLNSIPFDVAIDGLSKYNIDIDLRPDVVKSEVKKLFKVESNEGKQQIVSNKEAYDKLSEGNRNEYKGGASGIGIQATYDQVNQQNKESESSKKNLLDQINEMKNACDNTIDWQLDGERVIPKTINVAKMARSRFEKGLVFRRVKIIINDHLFKRRFSLYTTQFETQNFLIGFQEPLIKLKYSIEDFKERYIKRIETLEKKINRMINLYETQI